MPFSPGCTQFFTEFSGFLHLDKLTWGKDLEETRVGNEEPASRPLHWRQYYSKISLRGPSQFAALTLQEFTKSDLILDLGCGDGRDSLFFSLYGHRVLGIDPVPEAIKAAEESKERLAPGGDLNFWNGSLAHKKEITAKVKEFRPQVSNLLVYGRFLIHAITPEEEAMFWSLVQSLATIYKVEIALEFRNAGDRALQKKAEPHYRRFPKHEEVVRLAEQSGFQASYQYNGLGVGKYGSEEPNISRLFLAATMTS